MNDSEIKQSLITQVFQQVPELADAGKYALSFTILAQKVLDALCDYKNIENEKLKESENSLLSIIKDLEESQKEYEKMEQLITKLTHDQDYAGQNIPWNKTWWCKEAKECLK